MYLNDMKQDSSDPPQYRTTSEMSLEWGISGRRVAELCMDNAVPGAIKMRNTWFIPDGSEKPADRRMADSDSPSHGKSKPFVKWAGGKGQLLKVIRQRLPEDFGSGIDRYAEPFVGGGAVLFDILNNYDLSEVCINDINRELIAAYCAIRDIPEQLIDLLGTAEDTFLPMEQKERCDYFYSARERYNRLVAGEETPDSEAEIAALFIFLNKTCFNGLYRVNSKGMFNVPCGRYVKPLICDEKNIKSISSKLGNVTIRCGDYRDLDDFIDGRTFVYFDPPYRPITESSSFTAYSKSGFSDVQQRELAEFAEKLSDKGAKIMLSNSDPKNSDPDDNFFDDLYSDFRIERVSAARYINSDGSGRGAITEILVRNY